MTQLRRSSEWNFEMAAPAYVANEGLSLDDGAMGAFQVLVVVLCVAVNMVDGIDVLAAAMVAPSLSKIWGVEPRALGLFLSAAPLGMAAGALFLAPAADLIGRRKTALIATAGMTVGMFMSAACQTLDQLIAARVFTGIGIGAALAASNTIAAEFASSRRRTLSVSLNTAGYPIGATLGGFAAIFILREFDWRGVFIAGGLLSLALLPLLYLFLPESLQYLQSKGTPQALQAANRVLARAGRKSIDAFPEVRVKAKPGFGWATLKPPILRDTALICVAFFGIMVTMYFVIQWTPKVMVDAGLPVEGGLSGSVLMNLGGVAGSVGYGFVAQAFGAKRAAALVLTGSFVLTAAFGFAPAKLDVLLPLGFILGVFIFAAMTSLYALTPLIFPPGVRATGTGLALGIGRAGAILGPSIAGVLIQSGTGRGYYTLILALPLLIGAGAAVAVRIASIQEERATAP
jgi:benzoate transport